jgi:uncharacterized protein YecE (DUF72 family)
MSAAGTRFNAVADSSRPGPSGSTMTGAGAGADAGAGAGAGAADASRPDGEPPQAVPRSTSARLAMRCQRPCLLNVRQLNVWQLEVWQPEVWQPEAGRTGIEKWYPFAALHANGRPCEAIRVGLTRQAHNRSMNKLFAGASGYAFKEWKGSFYPDKIKPEEMLAFYAARLPTVEINNTFYRMPKREVLAQWAQATPESFRFSIKASRRITHLSRLKAESAAEPLAYLYANLATLGDKRGPVLFQLPPLLKKDLPRLTDFLALLPADHRAAFEFRDDSWFADDTYATLHAAGASLCLSEREDSAPPPLVETAPWGYVRLRLENYSEGELASWVQRLAATQWRETHVYFMHEPTAPVYAAALLRLVNQAS